MQYFTSKFFDKQFNKLQSKIKRKVLVRIKLFLVHPTDRTFNDHPLNGEWKGCRSINITGDIRVIYILESNELIRLVAVGSHSELYE